MKLNLIPKTQNSSNQNDFEYILIQCLQKNEVAQGKLYEMYFGYAKSICLRYSSNSEDAKDIMMTGFYKVFNNLDKYSIEFPFKGWLRTIMVNTALTFYRDNKKFNQNISIDNYAELQYTEQIINDLSAEELLKYIQDLPPSYRTVFVMHVVDGYNHREIAEILNIQESTSRTNYMKARIKLQQMIQLSNPDLFDNFSNKKRE